MKKVCTKCKKSKHMDEFSKGNDHDGLRYDCKTCEKYYRKDNKKKIAEYQKLYRSVNKKKIAEYNKQYRVNDRKVYLENKKKYYNANKTTNKRYNEVNKEKIAIKMKECFSANADYKQFFDKLTVDELPKLHNDGVSLEIKCRYCGKYFIPIKSQVRHRIGALNSDVNIGDKFLYCSENCKVSCPVYKQKKYPKDFKKATSREVSTYLRQMVFERDNWGCQKCGKTEKEAPLHCHHIKGYAQNKILANDADNCITLCKDCHKEVHKLPGCNYYELRCKDVE